MAAGAALTSLSLAACGGGDTTTPNPTDSASTGDAADTSVSDASSETSSPDSSGAADASDVADATDTNVAKPYGAPPAEGLLA